MAKVGDQEMCRFQCAPGRPWNLLKECKAEQGLIGILLKLGKDSEEMSAIFEVSGCRNFLMPCRTLKEKQNYTSSLPGNSTQNQVGKKWLA